MMTSKTMNSNQRTARKRWLASGSVLAGATALVALSSASEARAQSTMVAPRMQNAAPNVLAARQMVQRAAPRETAGETVSIPRVQQNLPNNQAILPNARVNMVAPTQQQQINIAPAPAAPSTPAANGLSVPIPQAQGAQQTGVSVQPLAASVSGVAGINVSAEAAFDDARIDFIAGIAVDTVDVLASSAIIDWTTDTAGAAGTEVSFLNAGRNLAFVSSNQPDYTVLNRVFTPGFDSAIRIDGNVTSTVQGGITGGNIWFYSPGGIVIGSNAAFNIGSLLLTTSAPDPLDVGGNFDVSFLGTPDTNSFIQIEDGASITANNNNSYIAMVAPRIEQNGEVRANGSIAYVAAEQATLTIDNGLFDISVDVGSGHSSGDGIVHGETGITTGPAQDNQLDEQGIYFVAVPKNNAINMLVGGTVGFEAATSAIEVDGKIILTTGDDVSVNRRSVFVNGSFENQYFNTISQEVGGVGAGDITLDNITLDSSTEVFAEGNLTVANLAGGSPSDPVDLELSAGNTLTLDVTDGNSLRVAGDLNLRAGSSANQGGTVVINVSGDNAAGGGGGGPVVIDPSGPAGLSVDGNLIIDTGARGLDDAEGVLNNGGQGIGGEGTAGNIAVQITGLGAVEVGGDLILDASANGGRGSVRQGEAFGGAASVSVTDGTLVVGGDFVLDASTRRAGTLVSQSLIIDALGGSSTSGSVSLSLDGGSANLQNVQLDASAQSSFGLDQGVAQSNDAFAGTAEITVSNGALNINTLDIDVSADPSISYDGTGQPLRGTAGRGRASISAFGSDTVLFVNGDVDIDASTGFSIVTAPVGDTVSIAAIDTGTGGGIFFGDDLTIRANSNGGGRGVPTQAGTVRIEANNGNFSADRIDIFSNASGSSGTDFRGGDISIIASNNGSISSTGRSEILASATGLPDSEVTSASIGQGGNITVLADDASISFANDLFMNASGFAGGGVNANGVAGQGLGGTVSVTVQGTSGNLSFADVSASTNGAIGEGDEELGPPPTPGTGSTGRGGLTQFSILGGTFTAQDLDLSSSGLGGAGGAFVDTASGLVMAGDGGQGIGGDVIFTLDGGDAIVRQLDVTATGLAGIGGDGGDEGFFGGPAAINAGDGGSSVGGNATFNAFNGTLTVTETLSVQATGNERLSSGFVPGGRGGSGFGVAAGDGGASEGGTATFNLNGTAVIDAAQLVVSTQAFGGNGGASEASFSGDPDQGGGAGGNAAGGDAVFNDIAGNLSFGTLTVNSSGEGGQGGGSFGFGSGDSDGAGGDGGDGTGGTALISLNQNDNSPKNYSALSQGIGGDGGSGNGGGNGGTGIGGSAEVAVNDVSVLFNQAVLDTTATGGTAGFNDSGNVINGADGGDAQGGLSSLSVSGPNGNFTANALVDISAGATGGVGEFGNSSFDPVTAAGQGGAGGNAAGGTAQILISDGASVFIDADSAVLNADTVGGQGGDGGGHFSGGNGGDGGTGGSATGGTVGIVATNGADVSVSSLSVPFALSSTGRGGDGGRGGDAISGTLGFGGDGGNGTGGSPTLSATGATIAIADVELFAQGFGGDAGDGGDDGSGSEAPGNNGIGIGGAPLIEVIEGSPGIITLGDVTITATGSGGTAGNGIAIGDGGQVTIRDMSPDPAGLITFGDLTVTATGDPASTTGNLTFESASGPITVNGNLNADLAGDIDFDLDGTGQVVVSGATTLVATNDITFTHSGNAAENLSLDTGARFTATAGGDFIAGEGTIIDAAQIVTIVAENIDYHDITSVQTVNLTATNGSITGTATGTIIATALNDAINLLASQDVTFGILNNVDGDPVTRDGNIDIDAGGDIVGVSAISGQTINLDATGLVMVGTVDTSVTNVGTVTINAGTIDLGTLNARFISRLTSDAGDLAIDTISGLTSVDLDSAANIIIGTADTSALSADALAGDISIGSLTTTGVADVRLNAGGDISYTSIDGDRLVSLESNTITGGDLVAEAQIDLTAGSIDIGNTRSIGGNVLITSTAGDIATGAIVSDVFGAVVDSAAAVDLGDITTGSTARVVSAGDAIVGDIDADGSTVINAGGNITSGDLFSGANSPGMTITASGDANIASATANGGLTFNVDGALTGGDFTGQGALSIVTLNAGSVDIASVESTNQTLTVTATNGDAVIGSATSRFNTTITGDNVTLNSGDVGGRLRLNATAGSIDGTGAIAVGGNIDLDAAQNVTFGSLSSTSSFDVDAGGDINFISASSDFTTITMDAVGDITGGTVETTTDSFANETITLNAGGTLTLDRASAIDRLTLTANIVDVTSAESINSVVQIIAAEAVNVGSFDAAANSTITASSVIIGDADVGLSLSINADDGDIVSDGILSASGLIFSATAGDINLATTDTVSSTNLTASGEIDVASATASNFFADAGTDLTAGTIVATSGFGDSIRLTAGNVIDVTEISAPGVVRLTSSSADIDILTASTLATNITGLLDLGSTTLTGNTTVSAGSIVLGDITNNLSTTLVATAGDIVASGTIDSDILTVDADNIQLAIVQSRTSAITATDSASVASLNSTGDSTINGASVNIDAGIIDGNLTATSTTGDITGNGAITVGGSAFLDSAAAIAIGSLDADSITLLAASDIQFNNLNSPNTIEIQTNSGLIGAATPGEGNITSGGDVDLQSMTMALGDITAAGAINAQINGNASFGDLDAGTDILILAVGTPTIAGVTSGGDTGIQGASVELNGGDVGGDLGVVAAAGDLILALDGNDQIQVDGTTTLGAVGEIQIGHTNNANGTVSLNSVGAIGMLATGDITSTEGAIIASQGIVGIRTESDLSIADVRGVGLIDLSAAGNTTVNDATLTGGTAPVGAGSIVTGGIVITAGGDNGTSIEFFDPTALALITGNVTSDGLILVEAGGNAVFQGGSSTVSDNGLVAVTGDDIIVQTGALVEAGADPVAIANTAAPFAADAGNLLLSAGELGGQLFTTPLSPISSIVIAGTVEANDFAAVLTANAIDGLGGTVSASSFAADIINAPNDGIAQSDDDGLLSANCLEGNICLGTINANNQILIGQNSDNDAIGLIVEQGTVNANTILITTRNDIVMGTNGIATVLNAVDVFSATSINGDVNLVDAAISSDQVLIEAAGSLIGTASLTSVNDIGITVGDSVQAAAIVTDGELTNVADVGGALEGQYSVAGDFDVGLLSLGAADIAVNAGGDINVGEAISPANVSLTADGDAFLGATDVTGDVDIFAQNIGFGNLAAAGSIILETNVGDIIADADGTLDAGADIDLIAAGNADAGALNAGASVGIDAGGNASFTGIDAGFDVAISAVGTVTGQDIVAGNDVDVRGDLINLGDVTAVGTASINGASIAVSDVMADQIDLLSGADILFDSLTSPNAIAVAAANGTIGANTGNGDIDSGAGVNLDAQTIAVGDITSNGNVAATATMGALSVGAVTNNGPGSSIALNAGGPNGTIAADSLTTTNGDILLSTGGDIALGSAATSAGTPTAGSIGILSGGDVTITGTLAAGEDVGIRSLGGVNAAVITAADDIVIVADGAVTVGSASNTGVGTDLFSLVFDDANAGAAGSILFAGETLTGSNIILDSGNDVIVTGALDAADNVTLTGVSVDAAEVLAGGNVTATSTVGTLTLDNTISGGTITITGQGDILIDHAEADGDLIATGQANLTTGLNSIITGGDIIINMPFGIVDLGNSSAGGLVDVTAEQIDFVTLAAIGTVDLLTIDQTGGSVTIGNGNITGSDLTAGPGASSITATFGNINIGGTALIGGSLDADASGDLFINLLTTQAGGFTGTAGGQIGFNGITSADFVDLDADSILGNGPIDAVGDVIALGTTSVTVNGAIVSGGVVSLISLDGPVDVDDVDADDDVTVSGFGVTTGDVTSGGNVDADANTGNATMGTIDATGSIDVVADGTATIAALNSGTNSTVTAAAVDVTGGGTVGGDLTLNATASDLAAAGTFAVGGAIDLDAAGDISFGTLDAAGGAFTADAGGAIDFVDASASGDTAFAAQTTITGGTVSSDGSVNLNAVGAVAVQAITSGTNARVEGTSLDLGVVTTGTSFTALGTEVTFNELNITQGFIDASTGSIIGTGPGTVTGTDFITLRAENGSVSTGDINTGRIQIFGRGGNVTTGDITTTVSSASIFSNGAIIVGAVDAASGVTLSGGSFDGSTIVNRGNTGTSINSDAGGTRFDTVTGAGNVNVSSDGEVTFTTATAANGLIVRGGGDVQFVSGDAGPTGDFSGSAGGNFTAQTIVAGSTSSFPSRITAGGDITLGTITATNLDLTADGAVAVTGDAIISEVLIAEGASVDLVASDDLIFRASATNGDINVVIGGDIDVRGADATGNVFLQSTGGGITANEVFARPIFSGLPAGTQGTQQITANGGNITIIAAGDFTVNQLVNAASNLLIDIGGTITLDAAAIGQAIDVNASDVEITANGQLGDATITQSVTFTGFEEMLLGGAGGSGAPYEIDNDEFSRIHSGGDVTFQVFSLVTGGPALITVDTLDVVAGDGSAATGQNIGQNSGLVLQSDQDIAVIGDLNIGNATADTLLIAEAIELVRVNSETGGIFILDNASGLAGVIEITARDFNAVTDSAFADIQGLSIADIDARLANSDGVDRPDGILRADTLDIDTTASQVFIQNTVAGTDFADRRGFDVNTLLIADSGGTVQPIVINGLIGGIAGIDTVPLATISSTFDAASTINGCLIGNVASCSPIIITPVTPTTPIAPNDDSRDLIEEGLEPEEGPSAVSFATGLLEYLPDAEFGAEPLIDEPVTGAGNEDLWVDPECPPGADPEICSLEPAE